MPAILPVLTQCVTLANDYTNGTTNNVDTNLAFNALPNTTYFIVASGTQSKDSGTAGMKMRVTAPTGATIRGNWFRGVTAQGTSLQNELISSINADSSGVFGNAASTVFIWRAEFGITIGSTGGTVALGALAVTSGTVTIYAKASMLITQSTSV